MFFDMPLSQFLKQLMMRVQPHSPSSRRPVRKHGVLHFKIGKENTNGNSGIQHAG